MLTAKEYFDICHKMGCRVPDTVYNADADEQDEWFNDCCMSACPLAQAYCERRKALNDIDKGEKAHA